MSLLQIQVDDKLKKAMKAKAALYGVPMSSLVRIVLVQAFLGDTVSKGNVFNAERDNDGKGMPIDDLISSL